MGWTLKIRVSGEDPPKIIEIADDDERLVTLSKAVHPQEYTEEPEGLDVPPVQPTSLDQMLSCLRKVRKSVDRWNSRGGPQGYLRFVSEYVG